MKVFLVIKPWKQRLIFAAANLVFGECILHWGYVFGIWDACFIFKTLEVVVTDI